jgi:hypothetical protein
MRFTARRLPAVTASAPASSTTAAAAPTITAAAAARSTAAATAGRAARLVDPTPAALEIGIVQGFNGAGRIGGFRHLDETESARLAGELVSYNDRALHLSRLLEELGKVFIGNCVGQIAYIQLGGHIEPSFGKLVGQLRNLRPC